VLEKSIKQLNRVSISVSLGLGLRLVLGLGLVLGLVLGLMPSSNIVLKSTVLSSSCVPCCAPLSINCAAISTIYLLVSNVYRHQQKYKYY